ncbi:hypothetical protein BC332_27954 [Capsicum chinense]|nr:hypothetical protein BC332_27954 [Capsicum chinense]
MFERNTQNPNFSIEEIPITVVIDSMASLAKDQITDSGQKCNLSFVTSEKDFSKLYHPKSSNKNPGMPTEVASKSDVLPMSSSSMENQNIVDEKKASKFKFVDLLKPLNSLHPISKHDQISILVKEVEYKNVVPRVTWMEEEVDKMNIIDEWQLVVIDKFSYGWSELEDLRIQIPKKCKIKGEYKIGFLRHRHILMRFKLMEDFVNMLSKNLYYITTRDGITYQMRPFIYDANFKNEEETTQAMT